MKRSNELDFKVGDLVKCAFYPNRCAVIEEIIPRYVQIEDSLLFMASKYQYERTYDKKLKVGDEVASLIKVRFILDERGRVSDWTPPEKDNNDPLNKPLHYDESYITKIEYIDLDSEKIRLREKIDKLEDESRRLSGIIHYMLQNNLIEK